MRGVASDATRGANAAFKPRRSNLPLPPFEKGGLGGFAFTRKRRRCMRRWKSKSESPLPPFSKGGNSNSVQGGNNNVLKRRIAAALTLRPIPSRRIQHPLPGDAGLAELF